MRKRFSILVTVVNLLICSLILIWLLEDTKNIKAQEPQEFLGPIYYGSTTVTGIFDHELPVIEVVGDNPDDNVCTRHNDGSDCLNDPPLGLGYDEHNGIDYDLNYRSVLAAADGQVAEAGWSDPQNHQFGLGLRIEIDHGNGYATQYGHLSVIVVEQGESVVADPNDRQSIIGISGKTGNSDGAHLHFGLVNPNGIYVNPYGWQGPAGQDPWELSLPPL
jgi:hypothetical protein